jgi:hypothetical protein
MSLEHKLWLCFIKVRHYLDYSQTDLVARQFFYTGGTIGYNFYQKAASVRDVGNSWAYVVLSHS